MWGRFRRAKPQLEMIVFITVPFYHSYCAGPKNETHTHTEKPEDEQETPGGQKHTESLIVCSKLSSVCAEVSRKRHWTDV